MTESRHRSSAAGDAMESLVSRFHVGDLALLKKRELLVRQDQKFCMTLPDLLQTLEEVRADYAVLPAAGRPVADYRTLYYDTPDLQLYHDHHRGRTTRDKVRVRHYIDRKLSYLEVKHKSILQGTAKDRWQQPYLAWDLRPEDSASLAESVPAAADRLIPIIHTWFHRLTLLGTTVEERITIDVDLQFFGADQTLEQATGYPGLVIVEAKQPRISSATPFIAALRRRHARPMSFSKYCAAVATCLPNAKRNLFLPMLRTARNLAEQATLHG